MLSSLWQDARFALRTLTGKPAFTALVAGTLALGIGATTAVFSVVDGVLLRPAPFQQVDRLVLIWGTDRHSGTIREPVSVPDHLDFVERGRQIDPLAAFAGREVNYVPDRGDPARLAALAVTHDLLQALGITPLLGRNFTPAETLYGGPPVALVGEGFWARSLGRDPEVIGRALRLDDRPVTIVGVVPARSDFGIVQILSRAAYGSSFADTAAHAAVDLWLPLQASPEAYPRSRHPIFAIGRLAAGASVAAAQDEFDGIAADLERSYPDNDGRGVLIEPLSEVVFAPARPALLLLLAAVTLVLLVTCANVANLLLVRGVARRAEIAMRAALGAGARRLVQQFLAESLLLTLLGAGLGVIVAQFGLDLLVGLAPADIPRIGEAAIDARVLGTTLAVSVLISIVFSMVPILQSRRLDLQSALKGGGSGRTTAGRGRRLQSALVIAELSMASILVIGATLLVRSFINLQHVDPGFRAGGVLKAEYQLPSSRYPADFSRWPDFKEMHAFNRALLETVSTLPRVASAAIASNHPIDHGSTNSFSIVGREDEARDWPEIAIRRVTPGYFGTLGVPLVSGRLLTDADDTAAPPVLLINQAAARRFFIGQNPLGKQISFWGGDRTIVGVVGDERFQGLASAPPPAVYAPYQQAPSINGAGVLLVRTSGDPTLLAPSIRRVVRDLDGALAVFNLEPLSWTVSRSVSERRYTMLLLGGFALVALLLAVIGIHGILTYTVAQRTREIGIRIALGARPGAVLRQIIGQGARLVALGSAIGLPGAWVLMRLLENLLFGVTVTDPATWIGVPIALFLVALAASYLPAQRAARLDPIQALRTD